MQNGFQVAATDESEVSGRYPGQGRCPARPLGTAARIVDPGCSLVEVCERAPGELGGGVPKASDMVAAGRLHHHGGTVREGLLELAGCGILFLMEMDMGHKDDFTMEWSEKDGKNL